MCSLHMDFRGSVCNNRISTESQLYGECRMETGAQRDTQRNEQKMETANERRSRGEREKEWHLLVWQIHV